MTQNAPNDSVAATQSRIHVCKSGRRYLFLDDDILTFLAQGDETGGRLTVLDRLGRKNGRAPLVHVHNHHDEAFYVLDGVMGFRLGDHQLMAPAGTFVFLPRGASHDEAVLSDTARALVFVTPGGLEDYFKELGEPLATAAFPVQAARPPDFDRLADVGARYGTEFLPHWSGRRSRD